MYTTPASLSFQVTDTTPVVQLTAGRKVLRGQGAERKSGRRGEVEVRIKDEEQKTVTLMSPVFT